MKYKIILVDDEEEVLESIHRNLDWEAYGFEVVETFCNGWDVLEFLESQEPDIVITDIRMPFMDGIELSKYISERYPQVKVMILSGYGDFNYAKEAMSYQVMDYILKPINAEEFGEVLQRVFDTLEQERNECKNIDLLKKQYLESMPVIRENLLNMLIEGNAHGEYAEEEIRRCNIPIWNADYWAVALIRREKTEGQTERVDEQYISVYIRQLIEEYFNSQFNCAVFYSKMGVCVIFGMRKKEEITKILRCFYNMVKGSQKVMGLGLAIGVGKVKETLSDVGSSFEEAGEALLYHKMKKDGQVIYMGDIDISKQDIALVDGESRERLFSAIKFGGAEEIRLALREMHIQLEKQNMNRNVCHAWMGSIRNAMSLFIRRYAPAMSEIFDGAFDFMKELDKYEDMDSFFAWLESRCFYLGEYISKERNSKNQNIIDAARECVQRSFGNPEMSLEMTARQIGLTPVYFSNLFKKETGETFGEYLTRQRMEEAIRLLDQTEEKICAIAEKTGYMDAGYFSHVFKKKYGLSPIQYRRQNK